METTEQLLETQTTTGGENPPISAPAVPAPLTGKRANWTIAHKIQGDSITWSVKGAGELVLDLGKMSAENKNRAMLHGMVQRISDAAAMARDSKTGASATPREKFEAMQRLVEHYETGTQDWSPARVLGAQGGAQGPRRDLNRELLVMALSVHSPQKELGVIEKFVKGLTAAQVSGLLVSEQLKEAVEVAREQLSEKEREASRGVDAEKLLQDL